MGRNFFDAVREDTGRHMLDSGGAYGRHHEQPPVAVEAPGITWDARWSDCSATIETAYFLSEAFTMRDDLNASFDRGQARQSGSWFELGERFMQRRGYRRVARDNIYNGENDLTQVYIWEVWVPEHSDCPDWIYADDAVAVLYVHTGCDVRGGYSRPYFAECNGEYAVPFDLCAGYYIADSHTLAEDARRGIDDSWSPGYSSYPFGEVEKRVMRWFPWASSGDTRTALLDTGDVVRIVATMPYVGG